MFRPCTIRHLIAAIALAAAGCAELDPAPSDTTVSSDSRAIVGGTFDPLDPAVVQVRVDGLCTGTLVAPNVVLTAAHCVSYAIEAGNTGAGSVVFGNGQDPNIDVIPIVDMAMHRLYDPPAFLQWDIAMVRLQRDAPEGITPIPMRLDPISQEDLGTSVRVVGFGVTDGEAQTGSGIKRQVQLTLDEITYLHIGLGTSSQNSCQGDSGGPTFARIDGVEEVIGVTSYGSDACKARSYMTRVDTMQDWTLQVLDAWSGPCQLDGECVEEGCNIIDPDCDICGFEGFCGTDCEVIDLDCPVGGRAGALCTDKYDCETRSCVTALDDERLAYCSTTCDPERPLETCPSPLSQCLSGPNGNYCTYAGPTPTAQGAPCDDGSDCRSGVCDPRDDICIEECGDGLPECGEPYSCQSLSDTRACRLPSDEGGCQTGGDGRSGLAALVLALAGIVLLGRRRQTGELAR